jgi:DNA-directed RNA polymerase subunit RPC12/RpoP
MTKWIAEYKCLKCDSEWSDIAGPTECKNCGYLYILWKNYKYLYEKNILKKFS